MSRNLGTSTSCNPQGLSRPVMGLFTFTCHFKQRTSTTAESKDLILLEQVYNFFAADCLGAYTHFYKTVTAMYSTKNSFLSHNSMPCRNVTPVYASGRKGFTSALFLLRFQRHNSLSSWQTSRPPQQLKGVAQFGMDVAAKCEVWNSASPLAFFLIRYTRVHHLYPYILCIDFWHNHFFSLSGSF